MKELLFVCRQGFAYRWMRRRRRRGERSTSSCSCAGVGGATARHGRSSTCSFQAMMMILLVVMN